MGVVGSYESQVDLSNRGLTTFPDLARLPNCTALTLAGNAIQQLPAAASGPGPGLRALDVSRNRLVSVVNADSAAFRYLESLDLSCNGLESVEPLRALAYLQRLDVSRNAIASLEPLSSLAQLRHLAAGCNRIDSLPDLSRCTLLRHLDLHQNLVGAAGVQNAHKLLPLGLAHLDLGENAVPKLCDLTALAALKELQTLKLAGNPCWVGVYCRHTRLAGCSDAWRVGTIWYSIDE
jgi:Leucine-rich repeat (LRR) protein